MITNRRKIHKRTRFISRVLPGILVFLFIRPRFVEAVAGEEDLSLFVLNGDVEVGTRANKRGFNQIKYKHKGKEFKVTDNGYTNADPQTDGEYIVWMSQMGAHWQVFMYHITSGETIQLSSVGNNVSPVISGDYVAWEGQVDGVWQIFVFNGTKVYQVTEGDMPCQHVGLEGDYVVYARKEAMDGDWKVYLYNIAGATTRNLTPDGYGNAPSIGNGKVTWNSMIDGELVRFQYDIETGVISEIGEAVPSEPVQEEEKEAIPVPVPAEEVEESTISEEEEAVEESTPSEEEDAEAVDEEEGAEEVEESVIPEEEEVEESTPSEEDDGIVLEEVTTEDIEEELGITESEDEGTSDPEEVAESTSSE